MTLNRKIRPERVLAALIKCNGVVRDAASLLGIRPSQVLGILDEHPELMKRAEQAYSGLVDDAVQAAGILVRSLDKDMVRFVLKTMGAKRGFAEKKAVELSGPDGGPVHVKNDIPDLSSLSDEDLDRLEEMLKGAQGKKEDGGEKEDGNGNGKA